MTSECRNKLVSSLGLRGDALAGSDDNLLLSLELLLPELPHLILEPWLACSVFHIRQSQFLSVAQSGQPSVDCIRGHTPYDGSVVDMEGDLEGLRSLTSFALVPVEPTLRWYVALRLLHPLHGRSCLSRGVTD